MTVGATHAESMTTVSGWYSLTPLNGTTSMTPSVMSPSARRSMRPLTLMMASSTRSSRNCSYTLGQARHSMPPSMSSRRNASHTPPFLLTFFWALATMPPVQVIAPSLELSSRATGTSISSCSCSRRPWSGWAET